MARERNEESERKRERERERVLQIWFLQQFGPAAARIAVAIGTWLALAR